MLDGILAFFCLASIICFVNIWNNGSKFFGNNLLNWIVLGILVGCSYMTKVTGLFLLIFVLSLLAKEFWENKNTNWKILAETLLKKILAFGFGFLLIFVGVWAIHLNNTKNIDPKHSLVADINVKINSWETDLKENRQNPHFNQDQLKSNIEIYQTFLNSDPAIIRRSLC
jgi:dolichyl-phosphate-mannose--protein O-mannosyl transferase